ncbi:hypothetical protein GCM10010304_63580 [Streptomyces roseoviolaceus]
MRIYRYDTVFVLDALDDFTTVDDVVWAREREIARVHQLIIQGCYDAGYRPIFVPVDSAPARIDFILARISAPPATSHT